MQPGSAQVLKLAIPGFTGVPRLQVLASPARVVVDLPGVNRGDKVTKKDVLGISCPQIIRSRMAQFSLAPNPVTRLVLEVVPGTRAEIASDGTGVSIRLDAGQGNVTAHLGEVGQQAAPPQEVTAPEAVSALTTVGAPDLSASLSERAASGSMGLPAEAPVATAQLVAQTLPEKDYTVAPEPPAPVVIKEESPKVAQIPAKPAPLVSVPAIGAPFQTLPALAVQTVLPAVPLQEKPLVNPSHLESRSGRTLGDTSTRYTGAKMTIDVSGADLTAFLRIIAETAHLNLIVDQDVQGTYTFKFTDTPWDQVLDVILKHAGLGKEVSNGIIRVAKIEKLQREEEDRKRLDDAKALAGDLQSITRPLSFAKANEAKNILDKMLTKRGGIIVDDRTNTLIITDLPRNLPLLDDLIAQLDVQIQQVQIEARVVEASKNWEKDFGVKWPTSNNGNYQIVNAAGTATTWGSYNGASWNSINNRADGTGNASAVSFSPGQTNVTDLSSPAGEFWVSFLSNRMSVNVILQALEKQGVVKIVSSPKVVTQNNKKAHILSGAKIPYPAQQSGNNAGAISVQFADANLELEVTPQITNDGTILMDIKVEKADADFGRLVGTTPTITRKQVETQVLVKDGGTAIMGGVYKNNNTQQSTGVPFLNKLPLIGFLFRNKINQDSNDELLIFITPRILKN
jgi:type IV pilus assembly protein PilQ